MKTLNLNIALFFTGKINGDEEILEVMENVKEALRQYVNIEGLAPIASDLMTQKIEVSEPLSEQSTGVNLL